MEPQSLYQYIYVLNNPIKYIDPYGLIKAIFGGVEVEWTSIEAKGRTFVSALEIMNSYDLAPTTNNKNGVTGSNESIAIRLSINGTSKYKLGDIETLIDPHRIINNDGVVMIDMDYFQRIMCKAGDTRKIQAIIDRYASVSDELFVQTVIWDFFISKGFTEKQVAGIMGNMQQESSMNPLRRRKGGNRWGLVQFGIDASKILEELYREAGLDMSKYGYNVTTYQDIGKESNINREDMKKILDVQLEYIYNSTPTSAQWESRLKEATSVGEATEVFLVLFEGTKSEKHIEADLLKYYRIGYYYQEAEKRRGFADEFYEKRKYYMIS